MPRSSPRTREGRDQVLGSSRQIVSAGTHEVPIARVSKHNVYDQDNTYGQNPLESFESIPVVVPEFVLVEISEFGVRKELVDRL
jgi:hypothetical protein